MNLKHQRLEAVLLLASVEFNIPPNIIKSRTRQRPVVFARNAYIYACRKLFVGQYFISGSEIAEHVGRDHSTTVHSTETCTNDMETNRIYRKSVHNIIDKYNNSPVSEDVDTEINMVRAQIELLTQRLTILNELKARTYQHNEVVQVS